MPYPEQRGNKWRVRWNTGKKHPETGRWLYDSQGGFDDRDAAIAQGDTVKPVDAQIASACARFADTLAK